MAVAACNFYSDVTRKDTCDMGNDVFKTGEDASAIMDVGIKVCGIFHIIEWIRTTALLCVILIGSPLLNVWYFTAIPTFLYGIVAFIIMHTVAFGSDAASCKDTQTTRYDWLKYEIIYFWTLFWIFSFPMGVFRLFKKEKLEEWMVEDEEDEDED